MDRLKKIKCFVFDMDGTVYLSNRLIEGAKELFEILDKKMIKYFFLTNNSSTTRKIYLEKLNDLGINNITEENIITSGDITIDYVKDKYKDPKVYLVGTKELENDFKSNGIEIVNEYGEEINAVITSFDTSFTYEKASIATRYIRNGKEFIATHIDLVCPIENNEFIPDCGAITKLLESATNKEAKFIGKPCKETSDYLIKKIKLPKNEIAIVGDRLYTDVATAILNDMIGIAVLTGETTEEEIENSDIKPTYVFKSINDIKEAI